MREAAESTPLTFIRVAAAVASVLAGVLLVILAVTVGHCSAFGGRCPAEPPPLWDDDVFGTSFAGGLLAVGVPLWLRRPGWRRLGHALAAGIPVALCIAIVARAIAAG